MSNTNSLPESNRGDRTKPRELSDEADRRLIHRCAQGDPTALRELVECYQQRLYRFLHPLVGGHEDAEEAALDVFLRIWQQAARLEGRASVATWLYKIAANAARDRLRRRQALARASQAAERASVMHSTESVNAEETALNRLEREERTRTLQHALQALRGEDRLLLVLYYQEELSYEEIGQITGYLYPVLKMRLLRARRRLRTLLEGPFALEDPATEEIG